MPPDNRQAIQSWKFVTLVIDELDELGGFHAWWKFVPFDRQSLIMGEIAGKIEELLDPTANLDEPRSVGGTR